jgi:gamma-glutamylcyclotransferase (GGCT)/AIG2-like uncharacterized protein YtfP
VQTTNRLFVYGTLRSDSQDSQFDLIGLAGRFVSRARMRGRLVNLGQYPGLIPPRSTDDWVRGEVYVLRDPGGTLARLDRYEGCASGTGRENGSFRRALGDAVLESRRKVCTWVYVYEGPVSGKSIIVSGDYVDRGE